jgi:tRNA (cytidine/uridine-2'-O-)-methyltransferase
MGFQIDDRKLRRAGLDYWEHLLWEAVDDWDSLTCRLPGCPAWYFSKTATVCYTEVHFRRGDMLVFGSESQGLPSWILDRQPHRALRIPIRPQTRSLNLSVSVGVAAFEALRQWEVMAGKDESNPRQE